MLRRPFFVGNKCRRHKHLNRISDLPTSTRRSIVKVNTGDGEKPGLISSIIGAISRLDKQKGLTKKSLALKICGAVGKEDSVQSCCKKETT